MWCGHCQANVAGQASADHKRVMCAACGNEITTTRTQLAEVKTMPKDPQELLARWASDEILDPYGPMLGKETAPQSTTPPSIDFSGQITDPAVTENLDGQFAMARTLPLTTDELTASTPKKRSVAPVEPKSEAAQTTIAPPP